MFPQNVLNLHQLRLCFATLSAALFPKMSPITSAALWPTFSEAVSKAPNPTSNNFFLHLLDRLPANDKNLNPLKYVFVFDPIE